MQTAEATLAQLRDPTLGGPRRRSPVGLLWIVLGVMAAAPGPLVFRRVMSMAESQNVALAAVLLLAAIAVLVGVGLGARRAIVRGRKLLSTDAGRRLERDPRPPIVLLRSFADDEIRYRPSFFRSRRKRHPSFGAWLLGGYRTYEERLAHALRHCGPVVTIGDPRVRLPALGADRMFFGEEEWRANVIALLRHARLIVLQVADTPSLIWEASQVVAIAQPDRVLLSVPVDTRRGELPLGERYAAFRRRTEGVFPKSLPEATSTLQFVTFDADWTPRPFSPDTDAPAPGSALPSLRREFRRYPGLSALRVAGGAFVGVVLALSLLMWWSLSGDNYDPAPGTTALSTLNNPATADVPTNTAQWRRWWLPGHEASAAMPGQPHLSRRSQATGAGTVHVMTLDAGNATAGFELGRLKLPPALRRADARRVLASSVQGAMEAVQMTVDNVEPHGGLRRAGMAFVGSSPDGVRTARGMAYLVDGRLHYAIAVVPNEHAARIYAARFVRSVRLR